ncbi:ABC transporter substrate-binding protein [Granulicoccus sp. GXG6511]|uniref:ABC transporter substrate-binding protein n=1 Tax=Granulicoccus sp. GXG6511 TaxID=3381351 RepID=UPI003D7D5913
MNRRHFLRAVTAAGLLTAGLGAAACTQEPAAQPGVQGEQAGSGKFTLGLTYTPDIQFAPFYVAAEKGYFTDAGLDVTLRHHGANEQLFGAIQAGQEDLVYAGGAEFMQARSQGVPLVSVATYYQEYPVVLVVPEDSPIRTAADLKGRSVGVPGPFGETWFGLLALLKQAGLTDQEVEVKHIGYTQQAALSSGQVDGVMGYVNNDAVRLQAAGVAVRTLPITAGKPPLVGVGLGTTDTVLQSRADDVKKLQEAVAKAVTDIIADPAGAVSLAEKHVPGLAAEEQRQSALATLEATIPLFGDAATFGRQDAETWESMASFLTQMELLNGPVEAPECYTTEIVPA